MKDFLLFKSFISSYILITVYYFGAFVIPFIAWIFFLKYIHKTSIYQEFKGRFFSLPLKYQLFFIIGFILFFLSMELCWRMVIEFLLAYIQIRDVLVK